MLVLSRKALQSVVIGEDVRITVVRVEGNQVRIGIEASQNIRILRGELLEEAQEGFASGESTLKVLTTAS